MRRFPGLQQAVKVTCNCFVPYVSGQLQEARLFAVPKDASPVYAIHIHTHLAASASGYTEQFRLLYIIHI